MEAFQQNIIALYQDKGKTWLSNLPTFLTNIENRLHIKLDKPFSGLSFNYTAPATTQKGEDLVFKCGVPNESITMEIAALKHYDSCGAVRLIDANTTEGWLLIERCQPGHRLRSIDNDSEAMKIAVDVMQRLCKPIEENTFFPSISDWLSKLQAVEPIPKKLMDFAQKASKDLLDSQGEAVLLHGDLHHYNILSSQRENWLAIDPKGVIGEREYEVGALMRNPLPKLLTKEILKNRLDLISEYTGFDRKRLLHWCIVQAVLSAIWCLEDGVPGTDQMIKTAETLYSL